MLHKNKLNSTQMSIGTSIRTIHFQIVKLLFFACFTKLLKRLNGKSTNPHGNHIFEGSKLTILDPQRLGVKFDHLFNSGKHAKSLK